MGLRDTSPGDDVIFHIMARRRSCKRFSPRPLELDKVLQIVQAGALAPSSGNIQNWTFITVTDIDTIRGLYHHTLEQEPFLSAMAAIIVCGDVWHADAMYGMRGKRLYTVQNCAAAIQNCLLAAETLGIGAIWIGAFDEDKVSDMFGIPNDKFRPQAIILLGYADYTPEPKQTKNLDSIVFFNKFGNRVKRPHLVYFDWATEWLQQKKSIKRHIDWAKHELQKRKESKTKDERKDSERKPNDKPLDQLKNMGKKGEESAERMRSKISDVLNRLKKDEFRK